MKDLQQTVDTATPLSRSAPGCMPKNCWRANSRAAPTGRSAATERPLLAPNKICPEMASTDCPVTASSHGRVQTVRRAAPEPRSGRVQRRRWWPTRRSPDRAICRRERGGAQTNQSTLLPGVVTRGAGVFVQSPRPRTVIRVCDSHPPDSRPRRLSGRRGQGTRSWASFPRCACQSTRRPMTKPRHLHLGRRTG